MSEKREFKRAGKKGLGTFSGNEGHSLKLDVKSVKVHLQVLLKAESGFVAKCCADVAFKGTIPLCQLSKSLRISDF